MSGVSRQHPHLLARGGQPGHDLTAERAGAAGNEDHGVGAFSARSTAAFTSPLVCSTGSR
jgi:hypothetical protein